jgi:TatD DNase family protein
MPQPTTHSPPPLVDSHVHLDRYPDSMVTTLVERAADAGVTQLLTVGADVASSTAALRLAARLPTVLAAIGIHPMRLADVATGTSPIEALRNLLVSSPSAIGEVGLDDAAPDLALQRRFLEQCVALAAETDLPLVLHVVGGAETHHAALAIVARFPTVRTVAHYFVGDAEMAQRYLDAGCSIAVGKPVTRPSEIAVRDALGVIPPGRLLLETDTYPLPGRTTEPRDVTEVCATVAELTGRGYHEVAATTTASFARFIERVRSRPADE